MIADSVSIDTDETGFVLEILTDEGEHVRINIQDCAEALMQECRRQIEPWIHERDNAYQEWRVARAAGEV